jgi:flagellar motor switch protein FliG
MAITNPPGGANLHRGITAYKQTLQNERDAPISDGKAAPSKTSAPAAPASKTGQIEGLIKTGSLNKEPEEKPGEEKKESRYRQTAKFLILLGEDEASRILSGLDTGQVEEIAKEIAALRGISSGEAETVFKEFQGLLKTSGGTGYTGGAAGGIEEARRLLYAAFGPVQGESFLRRAVPEAAGNPLDFLDDFSGEQVAFLLREETPAAAAMVLSRLSPQMSAAVLANTTPGRKLEIVKRIARMDKVSPEVLEQAAGALREKARHIAEAGAGGSPSEINGINALAAILKHTDNSFGERLLAELEEADPDIGHTLKDRLYTLEDVIQAGGRPLQEKLKTMDNRDIALLLKGRSPGFTEKILSNVSSSRRILIQEEAEIMGPVPRIEVEAAAREFLAWFRQGLEDRTIFLHTDKDVIL